MMLLLLQALSQRRSQRPLAAPLPTWEEQGLCIGATFFVRACPGTNLLRQGAHSTQGNSRAQACLPIRANRAAGFSRTRLFMPNDPAQRKGHLRLAQVAATNGHDPTRRINVLGYCRSVDMLSEVRINLLTCLVLWVLRAQHCTDPPKGARSMSLSCWGLPFRACCLCGLSRLCASPSWRCSESTPLCL